MMKRRGAIRLLAAGAAVMAARPLLAGGRAQSEVVGMPHPLLPLFPLGIVMLPGNTTALHIFEPRYREMIQECLKGELEFGILLMQGDAIEPVGCTAKVVDLIHRYRDGRFDVLVHGERRFRIARPGVLETSSLTEEDFDSERAFYRGSPSFIDDDAAGQSGGPGSERGGEPGGENDELIAQGLALRTRLNALVAADDPQSTLSRLKMPTASEPQLSFHLMNGLPADAVWKQELLELRVERERLVRVVLHLQQLIQYMEDDPENPRPRQVA